MVPCGDVEVHQHHLPSTGIYTTWEGYDHKRLWLNLLPTINYCYQNSFLSLPLPRPAHLVVFIEQHVARVQVPVYGGGPHEVSQAMGHLE